MSNELMAKLDPITPQELEDNLRSAESNLSMRGHEYKAILPASEYEKLMDARSKLYSVYNYMNLTRTKSKGD